MGAGIKPWPVLALLSPKPHACLVCLPISRARENWKLRREVGCPGFCSGRQIQSHWHTVLEARACFSAPVASAAPQLPREGWAELPAPSTDASTTTHPRPC